MSNSAMVQAFGKVDQKGGSVIHSQAENVDHRSNLCILEQPGSLIHSQAEKLDHRSTFRINIKMRASYLDVERIIANWTVEEKAAPQVASGIRFQDAYNRNDLDYIRENYPLLFAEQKRPSKPSDKNSLPLFKDSDSRSDSKNQISDSKNEKGGAEEIAIVLEKITGSDRLLNKKVDRLARDLHQAGYTAAQVLDWYERWWCRVYWKGNGEQRTANPPRIEEVREWIGNVKSLPPLPAALSPAQASGAIPDDPPVDADPGQVEEGIDTSPPAPRKPTMTRGWGVDQWLKLMSHYQVSSALAYKNHLQSVRLVDAAMGDPHRFTIAVPNVYAKDWIEREMPAIQRALTDICYRPGREFIGPVQLVRIEIEVES